MKPVHTWFALAAFAAAMCCLPVAAATDTAGASLGFVDVAKVILFHPLMGQFDARNRRFLLVGPAKTQQEEKARKAIQKRIGALKEEKSALEKSITTTEDRFLEKLRDLSNEQGTPPPGSDRSEYNRKRRAIETDFREQVRGIRVNLKKKEDMIAAVEVELNTTHLTSHDETARTFKLILDEIETAISSVADSRKIPVVLNSSYAFDRVPSGSGNEIHNPMPGFFTQLETLLKRDEGEITLLSSLGQWVRDAPWNLVHCLDPRLGSLVLRGGTDLTSAVIDTIYQRHKISENHRKLLQKLLSSESMGQ